MFARFLFDCQWMFAAAAFCFYGSYFSPLLSLYLVPLLFAFCAAFASSLFAAARVGVSFSPNWFATHTLTHTNAVGYSTAL